MPGPGQQHLLLMESLMAGLTNIVAWSLDHAIAARTAMKDAFLQATVLAIPDLICFCALPHNLAAARATDKDRRMPAREQRIARVIGQTK